MAVKNKSAADTAAPVAEVEEAVTPKAEEKAVEPTALEKKPESAGAGFCAYIGPTILGVIQSGTIYPGSRAEALEAIKAAVDARPLIAQLVVDGETLPVDRIKVKTPGNLLYVTYHKLAAGKK